MRFRIIIATMCFLIAGALGFGQPTTVTEVLEAKNKYGGTTQAWTTSEKAGVLKNVSNGVTKLNEKGMTKELKMFYINKQNYRGHECTSVNIFYDDNMHTTYTEYYFENIMYAKEVRVLTTIYVGNNKYLLGGKNDFIRYYDNGNVDIIYTSQSNSATIAGNTISIAPYGNFSTEQYNVDGIKFDEKGNILWTTPNQNFTWNGLIFKAWTFVKFYPNGNVKSGYLERDAIYKGFPLSALEYNQKTGQVQVQKPAECCFNPNGTPYRFHAYQSYETNDKIIAPKGLNMFYCDPEAEYAIDNPKDELSLYIGMYKGAEASSRISLSKEGSLFTIDLTWIKEYDKDSILLETEESININSTFFKCDIIRINRKDHSIIYFHPKAEAAYRDEGSTLVIGTENIFLDKGGKIQRASSCTGVNVAFPLFGSSLTLYPTTAYFTADGRLDQWQTVVSQLGYYKSDAKFGEKNTNFYKFIDAIPNIDVPDENGATLLMWAIYQNNTEIAKYLIKKGSELRPRGLIWDDKEKGSYWGGLLQLAVKNNNKDLITYLVKEVGLSINQGEWAPKDKEYNAWSAIFTACCGFSIELATVKTLVELGANFNSEYAAGNIIYTPIKLILLAGSGAEYDEGADVFVYLLQKGSKIDINDGSLFLGAFAYPSIMKYFIEKGTNVSFADPDGITPLQLASRNGVSESVALLIRAKVDINKKGSYRQADGTSISLSALDLAKINKKQSLIDMLVKAGAK